MSHSFIHPLHIKDARRVAIAVLVVLAPIQAYSQAAGEDYRIWTEHPRLFLNARRLRLLKRERERDSIRWQQFNTLLAGGARMAEPGFASALYFQVSENPSFAKKAVDWALGSGTDLRQLALVYDWCRDVLTESQARALAAKIKRELERGAKASDLPSVRSRAMATIAISEEQPEISEREMGRIIREWWRGDLAPRLKEGRTTIASEHLYAAFELLHAVRDNLQIDLRESASKYFTELPAWHLLKHYPATFPAAENDYRIPAFAGNSQPDLDQAALSRAAQLAMVAYDTNARENQYVQGWLIHDRFLMRGTLGIVYEFLWANPYQPGLSYYHLPLSFHEPRSGQLFLRSSWEDNATWFGLFDGQMQLFEDGQIRVLDGRNRRGPMVLGDAAAVFGLTFSQSIQPAGRFYVVGLKARTVYNVEVDDEELRQETTDSGGVLGLLFPPGGTAGVRISEPVRLSSPETLTRTAPSTGRRPF